MSIHHISKVWDDHEITSRTDLLVLLAIADYARADGKAWPSIESIAKKARIAPRGVYRSISRLKRQNKLQVETSKGPHHTNVYYVIVGGVTACHPDNRGPKSGPKKGQLVSPNPSLTIRNHQEPEVQIHNGKASLEEIKLLCAKRGLPDSDAEWAWHHWEGNGWTNGGKPIKSWSSTIISWQLNHYLPSQRPPPRNSYHEKPEEKSIMLKEAEAELRRLERESRL